MLVPTEVEITIHSHCRLNNPGEVAGAIERQMGGPATKCTLFLRVQGRNGRVQVWPPLPGVDE